jgi:hypothetical protein
MPIPLITDIDTINEIIKIKRNNIKNPRKIVFKLNHGKTRQLRVLREKNIFRRGGKTRETGGESRRSSRILPVADRSPFGVMPSCPTGTAVSVWFHFEIAGRLRSNQIAVAIPDG